MKVTVTRTHHFGKLLPERDWERVDGPISTFAMPHPVLKRGPTRLTVLRELHGGGQDASPIPDLLDPQLLKYDSKRMLVVSGFEEIEGRRYYQTWFIRFED